MRGRKKTVPVPMVTGHEYVGIVEAIGDEVTEVEIGQRVSGEGHILAGIVAIANLVGRIFARTQKASA